LDEKFEFRDGELRAFDVAPETVERMKRAQEGDE
jgi:hypothetical protein